MSKRVRRGLALLASALGTLAVCLAVVTPAWADGTLELNKTYELGLGYYTFEVPDDGRLSVSVAPKSGTGEGWSVYVATEEDNTGQTFAMLSWGASGDVLLSEADGIVLSEAINGGSYSLNLSNLSVSDRLSDDARVTVTIEYEKTSNYESEANNVPDYADPISESISGTTDTFGYDYGTDCFSYDVSAPGTLTVTFTGTADDAMDWEMRVLDDEVMSDYNADPLCTWNLGTEGSAQTFSTRVESAGTIYLDLCVDSTVKATGSYSIKVAFEPDATVQMHRLYNQYTGEHFYTASAGERDSLVSVGWTSEGVGWVAPTDSSTPVYRLYNPSVIGGDHHYTTNAGEREALVEAGWRYEGVGWYSDDARGVPLYRQYNPYATTGTHNYTASKNENDTLVKLGWRAEGIGWYGVEVGMG